MQTVKIDDDFCLLVNFAVRYEIRRRSFYTLNSKVLRYIHSFIPQMTTESLYCIKDDIEREGVDTGHGQLSDLYEAVTHVLKTREQERRNGKRDPNLFCKNGCCPELACPRHLWRVPSTLDTYIAVDLDGSNEFCAKSKGHDAFCGAFARFDAKKG